MKPAESKPPLTKEPEVVWSVISQVSTKASDRHIVVLHTPGTPSLCARPRASSFLSPRELV